MGQPEQAKAEILITGSGNVWRGVELRNIEIRATVGDGMLQFPKFEIVLKRGEIRVNGYADLAKGKGEVDYFSNADLEQFAAVGGLGTAGFKEFHGAKPARAASVPIRSPPHPAPKNPAIWSTPAVES